jgi:hypothetical protein
LSLHVLEGEEEDVGAGAGGAVEDEGWVERRGGREAERIRKRRKS